MTKRDERRRDAEPAGEVSEAAEARGRRPRTRAFSEAVVAAIPAEGETVATAPADRPRRPSGRWISEGVVAAIPAEAGAGPGGGADGEADGGA